MFAIFIGPFILIVAGWALGTGIAHAVRPLERRLATLRMLSLTSMFAIVSAACAGSVHSLEQVSNGPPDANLEAMARVLAGGLAESALAPMVGFALLAVAWLAATIGARKQL